jgi:hypothetical protein
MELQLAGAENDYNYEISCGVGQVKIGSTSYSGLGNSQEVDNGASRKMEIDCGIGEVVLSFQ